MQGDKRVWKRLFKWTKMFILAVFDTTNITIATVFSR